jgi:proteasome assembly chaperone (PAC2) family protein
MEKSHVHQLYNPKLDNPILVEGLTGFGNIGRITARSLIQHTQAKLFAEYYSPFFPDYVTVTKDGICSPLHYRFYASEPEKQTNIIILTGNSQPPMDNVVAHYEICEDILNYAQKLGCNFLITIGGVPIASEKKDVYVAATSNELAADIMAKGGVIYGKGRILGVTGLLLGLARERGLDGICLLGATSGPRSDKVAGNTVFQFLLKVFEKQAKQGM